MSTSQLLTDIQVAEQLQMSVQTLRNWRHERKGLKYVKAGGSVRYKQQDVDEYIKERTINF